MGRICAKFLVIAVAGLGLVGCKPRIIIVPHGRAMMLMEPIKDVSVGTKNADGEIVVGRADIPAGYVFAPLMDEEE